MDEDIKGTIKHLLDAAKASDEERVLAASLMLVADALQSARRIAAALEAIAASTKAADG